jgi:hypothetical protein
MTGFNKTLILLPLLVQGLLTILVWLWMYKTRLSAIMRQGIDPQRAATAVEAAKLLKPIAGPSDNFVNLFEVPVIFYVASIVLYITGLANPVYLVLCSAFVGLRVLHSLIHCSYNRVTHRFYVYALATLLLWATWIMLVIDILKTL